MSQKAFFFYLFWQYVCWSNYDFNYVELPKILYTQLQRKYLKYLLYGLRNQTVHLDFNE